MKFEERKEKRREERKRRGGGVRQSKRIGIVIRMAEKMCSGNTHSN